MFQGVYKGRRVLVTGHTGFKGSWLSQWLLDLGAELAGFSLYIPSSPSHFEHLGLQSSIQHFEGDVCSYEAIAQAVEAFQPEIIFHLAAQSIVSESYADPLKTFKTNTIGTAHVLEAARNCPSLRALVMITSDKCYENVEWSFGYRENDRLGGKDPYSASKACAENVIYSYWHSFFKSSSDKIRLSSVRAGNVIGGGDWAKDRIIPDCMRAWASGKSVELRNPQSTRPWQHVLEPLSGYLTLGARLLENKDCTPLNGEAFNFGPNADVTESVEVLTKSMAAHWKGKEWASLSPGESASKKEASLLKLCCDKALMNLNWKPTLSFDETVAFTVSWYQSFYEKGLPAKTLTAQQIQAYEALGKERGRVWAL